MKASFDGARKNLVNDFNGLMYTEPEERQRKVLASLRQTIVGLLCMYDPECADDINDLSDLCDSLMDVEAE